MKTVIAQSRISYDNHTLQQQRRLDKVEIGQRDD